MSRARDLADGTFSGAFSADSPTLVVDDTNNRVGVGEATPDRALHVNSGTENFVAKFESTDTACSVEFTDTTGTVTLETRNDFRFKLDTDIDMMLDSSGNLLVGKSSASGTTAGGEIRSDGYGIFTRDSAEPLQVRRIGTSNAGTLINFLNASSVVGIIGTQGGEPYIGLGDVAVKFHPGLDAIMPWSIDSDNWRDNAISLGRPTAYRFDDAYIVNGVTTGSDGNEKQDIAELDEAEKRVALAAKSLVRKYRWIDAVEKKGDDARIHVGVIAQDLKAAFEAEGLDAHRYGMFMSNTYWVADETLPAVEEELDEEGNVITEAKPERIVQRVYEGDQEVPEGATEHVRLGVRYPELLAFIIGAM